MHNLNYSSYYNPILHMLYPKSYFQSDYINRTLQNSLFYNNREQLPISHNGTFFTLKYLKESCLFSLSLNGKTAKEHEHLCIHDSFKKKSSGLMCEKFANILDFEHVGRYGNINKKGTEILKNENITHLHKPYDTDIFRRQE